MFKKFRFNVITIALAALCFTTDSENPGGEGGGYLGTKAAREEVNNQATAPMRDYNFAPFCAWLNRHLKAGSITVTYEDQKLKVDEILADGKLRLRRGETSFHIPFDGTVIDELLSQIV